MGVGDGLGQALEDEMGGGGVWESRGLGVEAATVVVITLLSVLGNAMVVATLIRRSLLHHPSNRLVLSLTGSNLILTLVVLPGLVTSLLMTPASPNHLHPPVSSHINDSDVASLHIRDAPQLNTQDVVSLPLAQNPNISATVLQLPANSSSLVPSLSQTHEPLLSEPSHFGMNSTIPSLVYNDDSGSSGLSLPRFQNSHDLTTPSPDYFNTELPLYLDVSPETVSSPLALYNQKSVPVLSQKIEIPQQVWHQSKIGLPAMEEQASQESSGDSNLDLTFLDRRRPSNDGNVRLRFTVRKRTPGHPLGSLEEASGDDGGKDTEGKEIRSVSQSNPGQESFEEGDIFSGTEKLVSDESIVLMSHANNQFSKPKEFQQHRNKAVTQGSQHNIEELVSDVDRLDDEYQDIVSGVRSIRNNPLNEQLRHPYSRRRKQGTRHSEHRKKRLRRNRQEYISTRRSNGKLTLTGSVPDSIQRQQDLDKDGTDIKREELSSDDDFFKSEGEIKILREKRLGSEHSEMPHEDNLEHIKKKVHLRIGKQHKEEHVILVRNIQDIEEEREKGMVVVVVDRQGQQQEDQPSGQSSEQKRMLHQHGPGQSLSNKILDVGELHLLGHIVNREREFQSQAEEMIESTDHAEVSQVEHIHVGVEWEKDRWKGGGILCQFAAFFTNLVTAASSLTVAVIAIDRYLAIVRPLVYGVMVTSGRCLLMLIWCWTQALLTAIPPLIGWSKYERREPHGRCGVAWGDSPSYTAVWVISVFLIPFSIMVVCYYHILQVARNKCRRIRVGKVSDTSPPQTPDPTACLDGFPFPLSVEHLTSSPIGCKPVAPLSTNPILRKLSSFDGLSGSATSNQNHHPHENGVVRHWTGNGIYPPLVKTITSNGALDSHHPERPLPCRSYSISGVLRAVDSTTNTNDSTIKPKRKLGDFGRSRSLCQVPQQPPKPCLRRVQSTFSVRHTLKKLSLGTRRPSWNWEGSPSKGFWTVFVVMGAHLLSWGPYTCMAIAEAILGRERLLLLPYWVMVTCTLLLFTASVSYPIVYGLYNRNIRKELLTCLCPTWARRRGSHVRRPSTLPSYSGSVLDFTSLRQRSASDKPEVCLNPSNGIVGTIPTISNTVGSLACPAPLMILGEDESFPTRGYNLNMRKPSQDSGWSVCDHSPPINKKSEIEGTVMVTGDEQDSDVDTPVPTPREQTTRRVSAPSVLSTVREDPYAKAICIENGPNVGRHHSLNNRTPLNSQRKMTILPLSVQLLHDKPFVRCLMRRSRSLDKIHSNEKEMSVDASTAYRSLRKNRNVPAVRETQFSIPVVSERIPRRRGSVAMMKVAAIPEDCGLAEYPELTDSGRGSVDSGSLSRPRTACGRGGVDSNELTKSLSFRSRGIYDAKDIVKTQLYHRRGSVDSSIELSAARYKRQDSRDSADLNKNPAMRQVSVDEGIGGDCLPEETAGWE